MRLASPLTITEDLAGKALTIIEESLAEVKKHFDY